MCHQLDGFGRHPPSHEAGQCTGLNLVSVTWSGHANSETDADNETHPNASRNVRATRDGKRGHSQLRNHTSTRGPRLSYENIGRWPGYETRPCMRPWAASPLAGGWPWRSMLVSSAILFFVRYFLESRSPVRSKNLQLFWRSSSVVRAKIRNGGGG